MLYPWYDCYPDTWPTQTSVYRLPGQMIPGHLSTRTFSPGIKLENLCYHWSPCSNHLKICQRAQEVIFKFSKLPIVSNSLSRVAREHDTNIIDVKVFQVYKTDRVIKITKTMKCASIFSLLLSSSDNMKIVKGEWAFSPLILLNFLWQFQVKWSQKVYRAIKGIDNFRNIEI